MGMNSLEPKSSRCTYKVTRQGATFCETYPKWQLFWAYSWRLENGGTSARFAAEKHEIPLFPLWMEQPSTALIIQRSSSHCDKRWLRNKQTSSTSILQRSWGGGCIERRPLVASETAGQETVIRFLKDTIPTNQFHRKLQDTKLWSASRTLYLHTSCIGNSVQETVIRFPKDTIPTNQLHRKLRTRNCVALQGHDTYKQVSSETQDKKLWYASSRTRYLQTSFIGNCRTRNCDTLPQGHDTTNQFNRKLQDKKLWSATSMTL
jgi:hypothetical protein